MKTRKPYQRNKEKRSFFDRLFGRGADDEVLDTEPVVDPEDPEINKLFKQHQIDKMWEEFRPSTKINNSDENDNIPNL